MIDLHNHHERCGHAEGDLESVARAAQAKGVRIFGWSDHAPLFAEADDHPRPRIQMAKSSWHDYLTEAVNVRRSLLDEFPEFDVRIGAEADYIPGTEAVYREELARPELDFVLGSVHEVGQWHIYDASTWEDVKEFDEFHLGYWRNLRSAVESGLFDVISHLDAITAKVPAARSDMTAEIEATLDCMADTGVAVEINGSGVRRVGAPFPAEPLLAGLVRRGVPITYGSDAHRFDQLGMGFEAAVASLRALGRFEFVTFRQRRPVPCTLEGRPLTD